MISIFELFKIGIGPSSSHTVGPMRAAPRIADVVVVVDVTEHKMRSQSAQNFAAQSADIFMDQEKHIT